MIATVAKSKNRDWNHEIQQAFRDNRIESRIQQCRTGPDRRLIACVAVELTDDFELQVSVVPVGRSHAIQVSVADSVVEMHGFVAPIRRFSETVQWCIGCYKGWQMSQKCEGKPNKPKTRTKWYDEKSHS